MKIYTTPAYLNNSWKGIYALGEAFNPDDRHQIPLGEFISLCNHVHWDEGLTYLFHHIHAEDSLMIQVRAVIEDLLEGSTSDNDIYFGLPERNPSTGKYATAAMMSLTTRDRKEIPFIKGANDYGSGRAALWVGTDNDQPNLVTPEPSDHNTVDFHIWRHIIADKALAAILVPILKLLHRALEKTAAMAGSNITTTELEKIFRNTTTKEDLEKYSDLYFAVAGKEVINELGKIITVLTVYRATQWHGIATYCSDPSGAFDWYCSCDGIAFTDTNAAEIQTLQALIHKGKPYFNYFGSIKVHQDESPTR